MVRQGGNERSALDRAIGGRIRMLRKMRGMSQPDLASAIGLSFQQVQRYETGESSLSVLLLSKVAEALAVAPTDLLEALLRDSTDGDGAFPELKAPGAADILAAYSTMDPRSRSHLLAVARALTKAGDGK